MPSTPVETTHRRGARATALALGVGLLLSLCVGGAGPTAVAAPYSGTVRTATGLQTFGPIGVDERPELRISIETTGNATPRGPLFVTFVRRDGAVEERMERYYDGEPRTYTFAPLGKPGSYVVTVSFTSVRKSVFAPSGASARQYVVRS